MKYLRHLPNVLTLSNLLMGTVAILWAVRGRYEVVMFLILGCLIADILDGAIARKLGVDSPLGVQLDSLADMVSFGLLPAVLIRMMPIYVMGDKLNQYVQIGLASMVAVSAGLRLARFNLDTRPREFFWGLPTPAGGVMIGAMGWAFFLSRDYTGKYELVGWICVCAPVFLTLLYNAPLKLPSLKSPRPGLITIGVIVLIAIVLYFIIGPISIAAGIVLYVLSGLLNLLLKWY